MFGAVKQFCLEEDSALECKLKQLHRAGFSPDQLGVRDAFCCPVPRAVCRPLFNPSLEPRLSIALRFDRPVIVADDTRIHFRYLSMNGEQVCLFLLQWVNSDVNRARLGFEGCSEQGLAAVVLRQCCMLVVTMAVFYFIFWGCLSLYGQGLGIGEREGEIPQRIHVLAD